MKKKQQSEQFPKWYWPVGLHDAQIKDITVQESLCSENKQMTITLDPEVVLGECVTKIVFYNFKTDCCLADLHIFNNSWWLDDELLKEGNSYILSIFVETQNRKKKTLTIRFDFAEKETSV